MTLDSLTLDIKYSIKSDKFEIRGDVNDAGQRELVETFLSSQMGAGTDESKPNILNEYSIILKWYPGDDTFKVSCDTGNKLLRDGILMRFLAKLNTSNLK